MRFKIKEMITTWKACNKNRYPDAFRKWIDKIFFPIACGLDADKMRALGIGKTMGLAKRYNRFLYGKYQINREKFYEHLLQEKSPLGSLFRAPHLRLKDGWALDTTRTLPHLKELLEEADEVIALRGNKHAPSQVYRSFFQQIITVQDLSRWPSFINFITSAEILSVVSDYLKFIPALSKTKPTGIRFVESGKHLDSLAHLPPRDSQLYHIDFYASPVIYVIVLLQDCALENGPFTFFSASQSEKVAAENRYWSWNKPYRLSDQDVYRVVPEKNKNELIYPRGTVLFVDTSRCLHFGARNGEKPRFQMMYGLSPIYRTDFSESYTPSFDYPISKESSQLQRMVLDRRYL